MPDADVRRERRTKTGNAMRRVTVVARRFGILEPMSNTDNVALAEEHVIWLYPDGTRVPGSIFVGPPITVGPEEVHCMISLKGLDHLTIPMLASSPLQAILLGLRHLGMGIHDFMCRGGLVLDPETGENFGIEHLFGPLLRHPPDVPPPSDDDDDG